MALEDVRMELEFFDDPRTRRAVRELGPIAPVYVMKLRVFAARFSPTTGDLSGFTPAELAAAAGYGGDAAKLLGGLAKAGWLVPAGGAGGGLGGVALADWSRHQPHAEVSEALRAKRVKAAKARWLKESKDAGASDKPVPTDERTNVQTNERTHERADAEQPGGAVGVDLLEELKRLFSSARFSVNQRDLEEYGTAHREGSSIEHILAWVTEVLRAKVAGVPVNGEPIKSVHGLALHMIRNTPDGETPQLGDRDPNDVPVLNHARPYVRPPVPGDPLDGTAYEWATKRGAS